MNTYIFIKFHKDDNFFDETKENRKHKPHKLKKENQSNITIENNIYMASIICLYEGMMIRMNSIKDEAQDPTSRFL